MRYSDSRVQGASYKNVISNRHFPNEGEISCFFYINIIKEKLGSVQIRGKQSRSMDTSHTTQDTNTIRHCYHLEVFEPLGGLDITQNRKGQETSYSLCKA